MKKLIIAMVMLLSFNSIMFSRSNEHISDKVPYTIKCYKCHKEYLEDASGSCYYCYATRRFENGNKDIEGVMHGIYKCEHGHTLYVNLENTKDRK